MVLERFRAFHMSAAAKGAFTMLMLLATACATSTRPPSTTASAATRDAGASDADDEDVDDRDGEVEATSELAGDVDPASPCPANMVLIDDGARPNGHASVRFCIDKYEASLVEIDADGNEKPYPHWLAVDEHTVRAVSEPGVFPQGFISEVQAADACAASGKRLCSHTEWKTACMGPSKTTFPYGNARQPGICQDTGKSAVAAVFGFQRLADPTSTTAATDKASGSDVRTVRAAKASSAKAVKPSNRQAHLVKGRAAETRHQRPARTASAKTEKPSKRKGTRDKTSPSDESSTSRKALARRAPAKASMRPASVEPSVWTQLNDPRLGQVEGALSRTGSHEACVNEYGVVDMVGNLHEWVKTDPAAPHGTFAGGYYLDTALNGDGCQYRTTAHAHDYHDYSTGFRCCAEAKAPAHTD